MLKIFISFVFLTFVYEAKAQLKDDISLITQDSSAGHIDFRNHPPSKLNTKGSAFNIIGKSVVHLYQHFISDQLQPQCIFVPSCSTFGKLCLQETNFLNAVLITGDRMTRCSQMNRSYYSDEPVVNGLISDPVENYLQKKRK
ncbi:MAG: membrane protein insertion efficiency factor YidD [Bacteroidia bacterium]